MDITWSYSFRKIFGFLMHVYIRVFWQKKNKGTQNSYEFDPSKLD